MKWLCTTLLLLFLPCASSAASLDTPLTDAAQEGRAQHLFTQLRCVVCAGQTLTESHTTLAIDMRAHVRRMVMTGATDGAILDYFTERYGSEVLTAPPLSGTLSLLWALPVILLLFASLIAARSLRR
jgi:cytochrome c-type biogenesis protein CcmH